MARHSILEKNDGSNVSNPGVMPTSSRNGANRGMSERRWGKK